MTWKIKICFSEINEGASDYCDDFEVVSKLFRIFQISEQTESKYAKKVFSSVH